MALINCTEPSAPISAAEPGFWKLISWVVKTALEGGRLASALMKAGVRTPATLGLLLP